MPKERNLVHQRGKTSARSHPSVIRLALPAIFQENVFRTSFLSIVDRGESLTQIHWASSKSLSFQPAWRKHNTKPIMSSITSTSEVGADKPLNELLSTSLVDIYVGQDNTRWTLHEKLLCYHSPFFRARFYNKNNHPDSVCSKTLLVDFYAVFP